MSELLDIFNDKMEKIGQASRDEAHREGYWHQTFHCWILTSHDGNNYVLVQKRSPLKKAYPDKLDISAAGHLVAGETPKDGIREVEEELGIEPSLSKMLNLGIRISSTGTPGVKCNREFCHVVLLEDNTKLQDHVLQESEVSSLVEIKVEDGLKLFGGDVDEITATAMTSTNGRKQINSITVTRDDFIYRIDPYYLKIFIMADRYFKGEKYFAI